MFNPFKNFFDRRVLRRYERRLPEIAAFESELKELSDAALTERSVALRDRIRATDDFNLDEALPEAFALVREAARRTLGQRHYDVQLIGGQVIHEGSVAEMSTGEGKTLVATAPVYLNALAGRGVHVVTVNEYLARRDAVWMGQVYRLLGLSVACLVPQQAYLYDPSYTSVDAEQLIDEARDATGGFLVQQEFLRPITRREAYLADITYGTNHEFGFDYLRDNLVYSMEAQVQRKHAFAIIDEADSILIDEARTPLIISAPDTQSSELYKTFARIAARLTRETDYTVDEKHRTVNITGEGIAKVEAQLGIQNLYAPEHVRLVRFVDEALKAEALFTKDKEYVVKDGQVVIVDEFTGRLLAGRRYNGGLHQAIEAKEGLDIQQESRTYAKISIQNYFRLYEKVSGMTGTAQTSAEEFHKVYGLSVVTIPTNRPIVRKDLQDAIYKNTEAKFKAIADDVKQRNELGQPVLIGTTSIEKNEMLSSFLSKSGVRHELLNAKQNEREGAIIAQAGRLGAVTVATNMAGRGVDILLGGNPADPVEAAKVRELGGLHVIGTERHDARRIDDQLRGRAGRQGDPGSSQFFLSLEDDLLRVFGGERIGRVMERFNLPDDEPIQMGMVSSSVKEAQAKVEGANFDRRKHLLEYDDVLNKQRTAIYNRRQALLESMSPDVLGQIIYENAVAHLEVRMAEMLAAPHADEVGDDDRTWLRTLLGEAGITTASVRLPDDLFDDDAVKQLLVTRSVEAAIDPQTLSRMLGMLDALWMSHLEDLDDLGDSVGLRGYAQRDPLVEYRREGMEIYNRFLANYAEWVFMNIYKLANPSGKVTEPTVMRAPLEDAGVQTNVTEAVSANSTKEKPGRNDPCYCGSGKKYKKCHGK